jgi:plasmid stabilization system protein ParE
MQPGCVLFEVGRFRAVGRCGKERTMLLRQRPACRANQEVHDSRVRWSLCAESLERVAGERVKAPRHFVLYRQVGEKVEFARLLHDSRDLAGHVPTVLHDE